MINVYCPFSSCVLHSGFSLTYLVFWVFFFNITKDQCIKEAQWRSAHESHKSGWGFQAATRASTALLGGRNYMFPSYCPDLTFF